MTHYSSTNSFLPSGAAEPLALTSTTNISRTNKETVSENMSKYTPGIEQPYPSLSMQRDGESMSPPLSMTDSTDEFTALTDSWRKYIHHLRTSFQGEKAHMLADRARADELAAEERDIDAEEIKLLRSENTRLLTQLRQYKIRLGEEVDDQDTAREADTFPRKETLASSSTSTNRKFKSITAEFGSSHMTPAPTISSANNSTTDPVWLPQSGPPARTFDSTSLNIGLKDVADPSESLRCPSKEFRPEDFCITTPEQDKERGARMATSGHSSVGEGVPGSIISPMLDGVVLKDSCVAPAFRLHSPSPGPSSAATPLDAPKRPNASTTKAVDMDIASPNVLDSAEPKPVHEPPPTRTGHESLIVSQGSEAPASSEDVINKQAPRPEPEERRSSAELLKVPPGERLIANAGHTPIHSRSPSKHESDLGSIDSGNVTPTQNRTKPKDTSFSLDYTQENTLPRLQQFDGNIAEDEVISETPEDKALDSPLFMKHRADTGDRFMAVLDEKLKALAEDRSRNNSIDVDDDDGESEHEPTTTVQVRPIKDKSPSGSQQSVKSPEIEELEDAVKPLKIREGSNFGMPWGKVPGAQSQ